MKLPEAAETLLYLHPSERSFALHGYTPDSWDIGDITADEFRLLVELGADPVTVLAEASGQTVQLYTSGFWPFTGHIVAAVYAFHYWPSVHYYWGTESEPPTVVFTARNPHNRNLVKQQWQGSSTPKPCWD